MKSLLVSRGDTSLCCLMSRLFMYCIFLIFFDVVLFVSHLCWLERKWIETRKAAQALKLRRPVPLEGALELLRLSWLLAGLGMSSDQLPDLFRRPESSP